MLSDGGQFDEYAFDAVEASLSGPYLSVERRQRSINDWAYGGAKGVTDDDQDCQRACSEALFIAGVGVLGHIAREFLHEQTAGQAGTGPAESLQFLSNSFQEGGVVEVERGGHIWSITSSARAVQDAR